MEFILVRSQRTGATSWSRKRRSWVIRNSKEVVDFYWARWRGGKMFPHREVTICFKKRRFMTWWRFRFSTGWLRVRAEGCRSSFLPLNRKNPYDEGDSWSIAGVASVLLFYLVPPMDPSTSPSPNSDGCNYGAAYLKIDRCTSVPDAHAKDRPWRRVSFFFLYLEYCFTSYVYMRVWYACGR